MRLRPLAVGRGRGRRRRDQTLSLLLTSSPSRCSTAWRSTTCST